LEVLRAWRRYEPIPIRGVEDRILRQVWVLSEYAQRSSKEVKSVENAPLKLLVMFVPPYTTKVMSSG
jgi:hypothetical protein